jgi:hypothetical protein
MPNSGKKKIYDNSSPNGRGPRPLGNYGYNDFMKLALNSFNGKKYARAIDNCRLAVENALRQNKFSWASEAYDLWINALFVDKRHSEIKRVCCDARSKLGSYLDLLYYEYMAARLMNDIVLARKFAMEYREMSGKSKNGEPSFGVKTIVKAAEIQEFVAQVDNYDNGEKIDINTGKNDG